jgi:hypothetical protein
MAIQVHAQGLAFQKNTMSVEFRLESYAPFQSPANIGYEFSARDVEKRIINQSDTPTRHF